MRPRATHPLRPCSARPARPHLIPGGAGRGGRGTRGHAGAGSATPHRYGGGLERPQSHGSAYWCCYDLGCSTGSPSSTCRPHAPSGQRWPPWVHHPSAHTRDPQRSHCAWFSLGRHTARTSASPSLFSPAPLTLSGPCASGATGSTDWNCHVAHPALPTGPGSAHITAGHECTPRSDRAASTAGPASPTASRKCPAAAGATAADDARAPPVSAAS